MSLLSILRRLAVALAASAAIGLVLQTVFAWGAVLVWPGTALQWTIIVGLDGTARVRNGPARQVHDAAMTPRWFRPEPVEWYHHPLRRDVVSGLGTMVVNDFGVSPISTRNSENFRYESTTVLAGWPFFSFEATSQAQTVLRVRKVLESSVFERGVRAVDMGWPVAATAYTNPLVPIRPLWHGTLLNTCLFGIPPLLLFLAPMVRAALRTRKGLCWRCGYPVSPHVAKCSECGTNLNVQPTGAR